MLMGTARSVRSLLAAAGLAACVHAGSPALAQMAAPAGPAAPRATNDRIDLAADLLAQGKLVRAKTLLSALNGADGAALNDADRARAAAMLANATRRIKALPLAEVSLQTAEDALSRGDLATVDHQAGAVVVSPKATNEQTARAKDLLAAASAQRELIAPGIGAAIDRAGVAYEAGDYAGAKAALDGVRRSGVTLTEDQNDRVASYQNRIVALEGEMGELFREDAAAGMMQPGVVRRRQPARPAQPADPAPVPAPTEPAPVDPAPVRPADPRPVDAQPAPVQPAPTPVETRPVPAPTPTPRPAADPVAPVNPTPEAAAADEAVQPATTDPIEQARRFEAQALLAEAEAAYEAGRFTEASARYQRVLSQFDTQLTGTQRTQASNRLAEARVRLGAAAGPEGDLQSYIQNTTVARQQTIAEFDNDLDQARRRLTSGDVEEARNLAASARLRLSSNRQLFNETEFQDYSGRVEALLTEVESTAQRLATQRTAEQESRLRQEADVSARRAAQERETRINEAIGRVRALQREMKYDEALQVVDQILFLDPINPTGLILRDVISDTRDFQRYWKIQGQRTRSYAAQELNNQDAMIAPFNLVDYPTDWPSISYKRGEPVAYSESEENRRALALLETKRIPVKFEETPLSSVVQFLAAVTNLNVDVDWQSLETVGIDREAPVSLNLTNVPVKTVLDRVTEKVSPDALTGAAWSVNDGVLTIASREVINKNKTLVIYDIRDLLIEVPDYDNAPDFDLQSVLQSGQGGGGGQSPFEEADDEDIDRRTIEERTTDIIDLITTLVDPTGWQDNGGDVGGIQQLAGNLLITNTPANHRAIFGLLEKLRAVRAMQINCETRFLLVSQDWFEQVGFDLDVYFNGDNNQVRAARAANPAGAIRPSDFFDFSSTGSGALRRNVSGAGPAAPPANGPLVSTPVVNPSPLSVIGAGQNSLGLSEALLNSPFGGEVLSAAPALGIAGQFLDDIQVDFLVKATQADRRTVSLTAPRLTFTNGQTSNIYVATQVAFVSDLTPIVGDSSVGFDPTLANVAEGVVLTLEGTVSADRRYVTLNVDAAVSRIDGFSNTAVTAIAGGQLVNSAATQSFIQAPTVTVTRVQTTVTVPDQGTILLGGQRLITESEIESGVPVLSKIPIINRFFSNRVSTKEEQTLLILLKPTILIQNEEEERTFPGLADSLTLPYGG